MILISTWLLFLLPTYAISEKNSRIFFVKIQYHQSIYSFIYGLLIGDYEKYIIRFVKKKYYIFFLISLIFPYLLINGLIKIAPYKHGKYFIYFSNLNKLNFQSIIIYSCGLIISMKFQFNNILLNYFGNHSFEMYLYQFTVFEIFELFVISKNQLWKVFLIFSFVMFLSEISKRIGQMLINSLITMENKKILNEIKIK